MVLKINDKWKKNEKTLEPQYGYYKKRRKKNINNNNNNNNNKLMT